MYDKNSMRIPSKSDNFVSNNKLKWILQNQILKKTLNFSRVDTEKRIHTVDTNVP